jgi:hypothetical protein
LEHPPALAHSRTGGTGNISAYFTTTKLQKAQKLGFDTLLKTFISCCGLPFNAFDSPHWLAFIDAKLHPSQ